MTTKKFLECILESSGVDTDIVFLGITYSHIVGDKVHDINASIDGRPSSGIRIRDLLANVDDDPKIFEVLDAPISHFTIDSQEITIYTD
jgi:hypothetical protein